MAVRKLFPPKVICGAEINAIVEAKELYGNGTMFAHVRLETGAVVDWHMHMGEVEYYYILKGTGIYTDEDGTEYTVTAGDVCTITPDHGHAIRNQDAETLEFIALVVYSH